MHNSQAWLTLFQSEIIRAETARTRENEGMARVCARRAAGIVIGEYLKRIGAPDPGPSAYDRLRILAQLESTPPDVRIVVQRLIMRINPDHTLPIKADLITDASWLAHKLLIDT